MFIVDNDDFYEEYVYEKEMCEIVDDELNYVLLYDICFQLVDLG